MLRTETGVDKTPRITRTVALHDPMMRFGNYPFAGGTGPRRDPPESNALPILLDTDRKNGDNIIRDKKMGV
jgi:hypothetical protein